MLLGLMLKLILKLMSKLHVLARHLRCRCGRSCMFSLSLFLLPVISAGFISVFSFRRGDLRLLLLDLHFSCGSSFYFSLFSLLLHCRRGCDYVESPFAAALLPLLLLGLCFYLSACSLLFSLLPQLVRGLHRLLLPLLVVLDHFCLLLTFSSSSAFVQNLD